MKTIGEDVGRRVKALIVACAIVMLALPALAQDITITNPDQLAQVALSGNYSMWLPFYPWEWRGYPTDWPLWCDSTSICLDSLPASTNLTTSMDWCNIPLAPVILTRDVLSGVTTVQSAISSDVVATVAAPSGYQPGAASEDRWLWIEYVDATNNPDEWGLTPDQILRPTVTLLTYLVDSNAYYSVYESNIDAEVAAQVAVPSTPSPIGNFMEMEEDEVGGDPCSITNEALPFSVVSIAPDGSGNVTLTWESCTDHVYVVESESSLTPTSSWTDVAWMFGTDQQTSWTDTNAIGLAQNFYQVIRGNPNTLNNGIPYGWAVTYGLDPLDPNLATEDPTGDGIDNLEKYNYGLNPQTTNNLTVIVGSGNGFATSQIVSLTFSNTPCFSFLEVSTNGDMSLASIFSIPCLSMIILNSTNPPIPPSIAYTMPSTVNGTYRLHFQYADANTNPIGPVIYRPIILDTIPPFLMVTSPTNGSGYNPYVSVQAVAFDPDPNNTNQPAMFHPLKLWINGQQYWNALSGTNLSIPRFPVFAGTNIISVVAQGPAGNRTTTNITWIVKNIKTNAPQLSFIGFQTNVTTLLPNMPQVWVSGICSDPLAGINASVNGGTPTSMAVVSNFFGALLSPLVFGTNTIMVTAADASGNTSSNIFTMVNVDDYQLGITYPPPSGFYAAGQPQVVSGYVSQYWDDGLPTQTNVVSVTVNGYPTNLGTSPDGNGNITFTSMDAVPVNTNGLPTVYNVVVTWANGVIDPPVGIDEGYYVTAWNSFTTVYEEQTPCQGDWLTSTATFSYSYSQGNPQVQIQEAVSTDCEGNSPFGALTNTVPQPSNWNVQFGYEDQNLGWPGYDYEGQDFTWDGFVSFMVPMDYAPNTQVIMTFSGCGYASTNGCDLSQVTWGGLPPITWGGSSVGYLITVNPGQSFSISGGSFGFPMGPCISTNYPDGNPDWSFPWGTPTDVTWSEEANGFWFDGFGNGPAITISGPPNTLVLCQEPSPIVTFNSSVAVGGGDYNWSAGNGLQVVGDNTQPSVNVQGTGNGGVGTVALSYTVNGQTMSATTNCIVRKPTSLILNPNVSPNPDSETLPSTYATTYAYEILDQYGARLAWPGLRASEILITLSCSETNYPLNAATDVPADNGYFTDTLGAPRGIAFNASQTIIVHVEPYATMPRPGCVVRHNCLNFNGTQATATPNSGGTGACCP